MVFYKCNGGDALADGIYDHGGGGSGGAIRLVAKNIYNKGLISVEGGNRGAGGGGCLASGGVIEREDYRINGSFKEIYPRSFRIKNIGATTCG